MTHRLIAALAALLALLAAVVLAAFPPPAAADQYDGSRIAQMGATTHQVMCWNGTKWAPCSPMTPVHCSVSAPTKPAATSPLKMQGLNCTFTPASSGLVMLQICGTLTASATTVNSGLAIQLSHGTGTAPSNAGALAGTQDGNIVTSTLSVAATAAADVHVPVCTPAITVSLTAGTTYWADLAAEDVTTTSDFAITAVDVSATEIN